MQNYISCNVPRSQFLLPLVSTLTFCDFVLNFTCVLICVEFETIASQQCIVFSQINQTFFDELQANEIYVEDRATIIISTDHSVFVFIFCFYIFLILLHVKFHYVFHFITMIDNFMII